MQLTQAYYLHAALNYRLFNGELEPAIIKTFDFDDNQNDDMIEAKTETELDPFLIFVSEQILKGDPLYFATVLLHEMIHQYNRQIGVDDTEPYTGKHTADFVKAATDHGLMQSGYKLTPETEQLITDLLKKYELIATLEMNFN